MSAPNWHKSSYSSGSSDNCVEVADNDPAAVLVRDTKDRAGGTVRASRGAWGSFAEFVKRVES